MLGTLVTAGSTGPPAPPATPAPSAQAPPVPGSEETPIAAGPLEIRMPLLPAEPATGKGRLALALEGNRRWCTYRDDRVTQPIDVRAGRPGGPPAPRDEVYTYGYQFTIAAVERSRPGETLMLFESPIIRTTVLRQALKVGKGMRPIPKTPRVPDPDQTKPSKTPTHEMPSTIVPLWQDQYRCAKLPETIDLDLDPGVYDVYMAFDILLKSGAWVHRSIAYETDVEVRADQHTRLEGLLNMSGGARRDFRISKASEKTEAGAAGGR